MNDTLLGALTLGSIGLTAYHHVGYPALLRLARRQPMPIMVPDSEFCPTVAIVMPAHDEADHIVQKIRNLAALDYPAHRLRILIACDGCGDDTVALCHATLAEPGCSHLDAAVIDFAENRGKVAVVNDAVAMATAEILVMTDVSAMLPADALRRATGHFADPRVGAAGGTYRIRHSSSEGEAAYWSVQLSVKRGEAALGAPLGLHGAFYAVRRLAWQPLPADTINDDFILPMQVYLRGWKVIYDDTIVADEIECVRPGVEYRRRRRIAAGNAQQLRRLLPLLHPRHGGVAFAFASGKALRVLMPLVIVLGLLGSLALCGQSDLFAFLAVGQIVGLICAAAGALLGDRASGPFALAHYIVAGHLMGLSGLGSYLMGHYRGPWVRAQVVPVPGSLHVPRSVVAAKRAVDVTVALLALVVTAPLWPFIAVAIKLNSPGPVLFRQRRIGRALGDRTELFDMIKFRSMYIDAEARVGAVWATSNDPRITPVGLFLRKTRLDEIPQLLNVLKGEMAIVGPRPERPGFYGRLETAIPFFADRTSGLRPGITGLAQVNQGYDRNIEDVRRKVAFDHAYALRLTVFLSWLRSDIRIMTQTITVMATGRGQ